MVGSFVKCGHSSEVSERSGGGTYWRYRYRYGWVACFVASPLTLFLGVWMLGRPEGWYGRDGEELSTTWAAVVGVILTISGVCILVEGVHIYRRMKRPDRGRLLSESRSFGGEDPSAFNGDR